MEWLTWDDLTEAEKEEAKESYICIREYEEERNRNDITSNPDYDYPITADGIECCKFERMASGYIFVNI